ncbi:MAG TPA: hypothetical protein VFD37_04125 [Solirubrobacterales bacterium]|nr:hypothetical protein [Solirubrobacterales bacterium]
MSVIVWSAMGIAIWHFTVFLPDRFWQGIVGAFIGAWIGAVVTGAMFQILSGRTIGETDVITALVAVPGTLIGIAVIWWIGVRQEERAE